MLLLECHVVVSLADMSGVLALLVRVWFAGVLPVAGLWVEKYLASAWPGSEVLAFASRYGLKHGVRACCLLGNAIAGDGLLCTTEGTGACCWKDFQVGSLVLCSCAVCGCVADHMPADQRKCLESARHQAKHPGQWVRKYVCGMQVVAWMQVHVRVSAQLNAASFLSGSECYPGRYVVRSHSSFGSCATFGHP